MQQLRTYCRGEVKKIVVSEGGSDAVWEKVKGKTKSELDWLCMDTYEK